jgi:hypothetical protein
MNFMEMEEILGMGILLPSQATPEETEELRKGLARVNEEMQEFSRQNNAEKMEAYIASTQAYLA